jgi:hypothetical protein
MPHIAGSGAKRSGDGRPFGQHRFDKVYGKDTRQGPYRQDQLWECVGLCNRAEQTLHVGIIMAYAVAEA